MSENNQTGAYRVLARTYRPSIFADLVGQETLIRTLSNAFETGRIAHAYLLTGVRGIGKTTTARLIARALNCLSIEGPTIEPCGNCESCQAIIEDRHVDVIEMDAASRTGVDDIRGIIESVRYAPVTGRNKVYIIDEVHMLSKNAFNALLKTLEEPPPKVIFIFATTEVRKIPLTVLSRCQRFDLRRVEPDALTLHLQNISTKEGVDSHHSALTILSRAAEGSVRDALSLLDQAIVSGNGVVSESVVQEMLGLSDKTINLDLFERLIFGDIVSALGNLREQISFGADPIIVIHELLNICHWISRIKAIPKLIDTDSMTKSEQNRGNTIADQISMAALARVWQMLLKGLQETKNAPDPLAALEMLLIRIAYVSDLPSPNEIIEKITKSSSSNSIKESSSLNSLEKEKIEKNISESLHNNSSDNEGKPSLLVGKNHSPEELPLKSFSDVVELTATRGEPRLYADLINYVRIIHFEIGSIRFSPTEQCPPDLAKRLQRKLIEWTNISWIVETSSNEDGLPTLYEISESERIHNLESAAEDPSVKAVLDEFPGSEIIEIRDSDLANNSISKSKGRST